MARSASETEARLSSSICLRKLLDTCAVQKRCCWKRENCRIAYRKLGLDFSQGVTTNTARDLKLGVALGRKSPLAQVSGVDCAGRSEGRGKESEDEGELELHF